MVPKKLKLISYVSIAVSGFFIMITFILSAFTDDIMSKVFYMTSMSGFIVSLFGAYLLLKANKTGYYLYLFGSIFSLISSEIIVFLSAIWVFYALFVILRDIDTRAYLRLSNSQFENPFKIKYEDHHLEHTAIPEYEKKIIEYIKSVEHQGYNDEQVKQVLLKSGYPENLIDDALKKAK
jgi:hypothetical protein